MNIRHDLLKGIIAGPQQHCALMTMIPLCLPVELQEQNYVAPNKLRSESRSYGTMSFMNVGEKPVIVPSHTAYMTEQSAQDHAMVKMGVVLPKDRKTYNDCACIQERQCGYIASGEHSLAILPWSLRQSATETRKEVNFSKLWPVIKRFNHLAGVEKSEGHLIYFYEKYKVDLERFVAQFEPIAHQVGAIILVNGVVIGIERTPNEKYFEDIFDALIRTCYGTAAVLLTKGINDVKKTEDYKIYPHINTNVSSLQDIIREYRAAISIEKTLYNQVINSFVDTPLTESIDEALGSGITILTVKNDQVTGQVMTSNGDPLYSSLVVNRDWLSKNHKWAKAGVFEL